MSGTSGVLGVSAFTVRATDVLGGFDDQALQLAVNLGPLTATCAPPIGEVGVAYSQTCVPKLGLPPYTCALLSGNTSAGTILNGDCTLSGTPTAAGSKPFVTRVADSGGLFLNVGTTADRAARGAGRDDHAAATEGGYVLHDHARGDGGQPPYSWSLAGGGLPVGLTLERDRGPERDVGGARRQRVHGPRDRCARRLRRPGPAARGEPRTAERAVRAADRRGRCRLRPDGVRAQARPAAVHVRPRERQHVGRRHRNGDCTLAHRPRLAASST